MLLPYVELRYVDETIGYGTFATRFIPKGTITWVQDAFDRAFSPAAVEAMHPLHRAILDKYSYPDASGDLILCWDHGRFVNHSCEATCLAPGFEFEIAVRDILPGEEVTDDYGTLNTEPFICHCRKPRCRGVVRCEDIVVYGDVWDESLLAAFRAVGNVPQPLWDLVQEKDEVAEVLAGQRPLPSCRQHAVGVRAPQRWSELRPQAAQSQMR
jgi:hypothetical protein